MTPTPASADKGPRGRLQRWSLALCLATAWVVLGQPRETTAQSGSTWTHTGDGLVLTITTAWFDAGGYRPIRIKLLDPSPAKAQRTFRLEFKSKFNYASAYRETLILKDVDLPARAGSVETTLALPQLFALNQFDVTIFEDGEELKNLSLENMGTGAWSNDWSEALPSVLIVRDQLTASVAPTAVTTTKGAPGPSYMGVQVMTQTVATVLGFGGELEAAVADLPERWIDYSNVDVICLTMPQVAKLKAERPKAWTALRLWTQQGGNLVVSVGANGLKDLAGLEKALKLPASMRRTSLNPLTDVAGHPGWTAPNLAIYGQAISTPVAANSGTYYGETVVQFGPDGQPISPTPQPQVPVTPPTEPTFLLHSWGLGALVAVASDDLTAGTVDTTQWTWIMNTLGPDRWMWINRHGVSVQRDNVDYWNFLIPGVGLAPVTWFRFLITVFVLAIGPLNYYWLKRRGKLHLLVIMAPAMALLITLGLFLYALLADGLGVKARVRSFTHLDQRTGEAVCWARNSFYAGMAPWRGLDYSEQVITIPIQPVNTFDNSGPAARQVNWNEPRQNLATGWIASRSPSQLLTVKAGRSKAGLSVVAGARAGDPPRVRNRLGVHVQLLLLTDREGAYFKIHNLAPGASATLAPAELEKEAATLQKLALATAPRTPEDFDPYTGQSGLFGFNRRWWWGSSNQNVQAPDCAKSLLEKGIGLLGADLAKSGLAPGNYIAVTDGSPALELGLDNLEQEASLHVIVGRW